MVIEENANYWLEKINGIANQICNWTSVLYKCYKVVVVYLVKIEITWNHKTQIYGFQTTSPSIISKNKGTPENNLKQALKYLPALTSPDIVQ